MREKMYKISNINLGLKFDKTKLNQIVADKTKIDKSKILNCRLNKLSLDARHKNDIKYIASIVFDYMGDLNLSKYKNIEKFEEIDCKTPKWQGEKKDIVIVGSGPSGLFTALEMVESGCSVTILERGYEMEKRKNAVDNLMKNGVLDVKSNIQFGEGGAGTFSDGKLNTGIKSEFIRKVLQTFVNFGGNENILYDSKPHIGTDILSNVIVNIRNYLIDKGCKILFEHTLKNIEITDGRMSKIIIDTPNGETYLAPDILIMAIGHSSRDTIRMLYNKGLNVKPKPFSMGVRIEHKQSDINMSQYGDVYLRELPPADYQLSERLDSGRVVYTFCMCPGGVVVPATSEEGAVVTNGMSYNARDGENANSALLVSISPEDFDGDNALSGIEFQEKYERLAFSDGFVATVQKVGDFLAEKVTTSLGKVKPSYKPNFKLGSIEKMLPNYIVTSLKEGLVKLDKRLKNFADSDAILTGIESRSSAPYQVLRDEEMRTNISNLYMIGEGAGFAGGIVSSAVDGIKVARKIIEKYN
jgi:uncharacterized FAD-dependent dehydrogenase